MSKFVSFSKIGQFRGVIDNVKHHAQYVGMDADGNMIMNRTAKMPVIPFKGTVKLHGTNAGVGVNTNSEIWYQSRAGIITPEHDNAGFAFFANSKKDIFLDFVKEIRTRTGLVEETIVIFGEWCGGNIQKGVAISGLEKMFVIFAVKVAIVGNEAEEENSKSSNYYLEDHLWEDLKSPENKIYNINDFESTIVNIDFNNLEQARIDLVEVMAKVEAECPVGKYFGRKLGVDNTTGEGNVWVGWWKGNRYVFKVKGEEHSVTNVKTLVAIDVEKLNSINEFIDYAVTENRLNQAIEQVFTSNSITPDIKCTGDFIRWIIKDITSEESDTMVKNNLEPKELNKYISDRARKWFVEYLDKLVGL
jgi:hypothetical protein